MRAPTISPTRSLFRQSSAVIPGGGPVGAHFPRRNGSRPTAVISHGSMRRVPANGGPLPNWDDTQKRRAPCRCPTLCLDTRPRSTARATSVGRCCVHEGSAVWTPPASRPATSASAPCAYGAGADHWLLERRRCRSGCGWRQRPPDPEPRLKPAPRCPGTVGARRAAGPGAPARDTAGESAVPRDGCAAELMGL
jgi:hypothetical protein